VQLRELTLARHLSRASPLALLVKRDKQGS
jgi:hypothetical protein